LAGLRSYGMTLAGGRAMLNRRSLLKATAGLAVSALCPITGLAQSGRSITEFGVSPETENSQSRAFATALHRASFDNVPLHLPPGRYHVGQIALPRNLHLTGIAGMSELVFTGGSYLADGRDMQRLTLDGVTFDGAQLPFDDPSGALLNLDGVKQLSVTNCTIRDSSAGGLYLKRAAGRVSGNSIVQIGDVGIFSRDAEGLDIDDNRVSHCGNGGILVHRSSPGSDGSRVNGNRVSHIRADLGGTGPFGNGINVYRAGDVAIEGNHVSDCAFSAIRSNGGSNLSVAGNHCLRSGETAIYSEFSFEGAVISDNIVDGAANGISIVNFNEGGRLATCSGNLVRNLSLDGPYQPGDPGFGLGITVEADCAVSGNVIEGAPRFGMLLGWGPFLRNVSATGNVIRRAGTGIAVSVVEGAGKAVIGGNVISDTKDGAIRGYRWAEAVTDDLIGQPTPAPHLVLSGNSAG
jgi:uncharacterized secreted repeat protein (TIGR03808 family)